MNQYDHGGAETRRYLILLRVWLRLLFSGGPPGAGPDLGAFELQP